jgi:TolB protein
MRCPHLILAGLVALAGITVLSAPRPERPRAAEPASLQGKRLLYSASRIRSHEIWTADLHARSRIQITSNPALSTWAPRISPDGRSFIAYRAPRSFAHDPYRAELWKFNIDGSDGRPIVRNMAFAWAAQADASWSPDGLKLVMAALSPADQRWHLFITDAEGRGAKRVSQGARLYAAPTFSPDGKKIAYVAYPEGYAGVDARRLELFISDLDGDNERRLTYDNVRDHHPVFSPDGRLIAFETETDPKKGKIGQWGIRIIEPTGDNLRTIIDDGHANSGPKWSGDSMTLFFDRCRFIEGDTFNIWRINLDGRRFERAIFDNSGSDRGGELY